MGRKKLQYALHVMVNEKLREINHNFKKIRIFVLKISSKTVPFLCLSDNTKAVAGGSTCKWRFLGNVLCLLPGADYCFYADSYFIRFDTDWFLLSALAIGDFGLGCHSEPFSQCLV